MHGLLVSIALCYVLVKIPSWVLGSIRGGGGKSVLGSMVRGFVAYKTLGLARAGAQSLSSLRLPRSLGKARRPDPYAHAETTQQGQWMLPFENLTRAGKPRSSSQTTTGASASTGSVSSRSSSAGGSGRGRSGVRASGAQQARPRGHQGWLLNREGEVDPAAVPARYPGGLPVQVQAGDQRMLSIMTRHVPDRVAREPVGEHLNHRGSRSVPPGEQQASMVDPESGGLTLEGMAPVWHPARPGQQQALDLQPQSVPSPRPRQPDSPAPSAEAVSERDPFEDQLSMLHRTGRVRPQARALPSEAERERKAERARQARRARTLARAQRRQRAASAPPSPEFLAPAPPPATQHQTSSPNPTTGERSGRGRDRRRRKETNGE